MKKKCSIDGCNKPTQGRGLCQAHYMKWWRNGGKSETRFKHEHGMGTVSSKGYIEHFIDGHRVGEHRVLAEKALGKQLPKGAVVHHVNEKRWDNRPNNLVICPNQEYHSLLHRRMKELGITFNEDY